MKEGIVLIPAYKPDKELLKLVKGLKDEGFKIVVVNDGSGKEFDNVFNEAGAFCDIVAHEKNKGKGAALKTGIKYIMENLSEYPYFITADADGQHLISDILRVREVLEQNAQMALTTRRFRGKIPFRSMFGNLLSRFVFAMMTGRYFSDNQSGLRGFSMEQCEWLVRVEGEKYDYEMNVLYFAEKQLIPIKTIDIDAVYIDNNKSSHFNPVKDTIRIYKQLFRSARGTFLSALVTEALLLISTVTVDYKYLFITLPTIGILTVIFNIFFCITCSMHGFHFRDYTRMFMRMALRYSFYILFAWFVFVLNPAIPIFFSFNLIMLLIIIPEYYLIKLCYLIFKKK